MIYIILCVTAALTSAILWFCLRKSGYFTNETTVTVNEAAKGGEAAEAAADGDDGDDGDDENKPPPSYTVGQGTALTAAVAAVGAAVYCLVYRYTRQNAALNPFLFVKLCILYTLIAGAALTDFKRYKIPNAFILAGLVCRAVIYVLEFVFAREMFFTILKNDGLGFLIGFVLLFIVALIARGGIGFGDIKLFGVIGLMAGSGGVFVTVFVSLLINSIVAVILIAMKKKTLRSSLPMAPFIYAGFVSVCVLGIF